MDKDGFITLTDAGREIATTMYERHTMLSDWLVHLGVNKETAIDDACRIEYVISAESFEAIKTHAIHGLKRGLIPFFFLYALFFQNVCQCCFTACVTANDRNFISFRLLHRTLHHLMRYRIRKQYQQIRCTDLFIQICRHLRKYFCFAPILFTDFL